jgi:peptidoglycan/LPS O-acetylase OafA/YrhL
MPRPVDRPEAYLPGLDGLRALSVIAVVGYHLGVTGLGGGFLGVGMFFTLSGFLITSILCRSWNETGRIDLRRFWLRRARRLLPAVLLLLGVILAVTAVAQPENWAARWREAVAAVLYVSNWFTVYNEVSYFDRVGGLRPLDHLWSLAIEEQFYVIWPMFFAGAMRILKGRVRWLAVITIGLAAASFFQLNRLAVAGIDNTRAYEGTDSRAGGILVGAAVAMLWSPQSLTKYLRRRTQVGVDSAAALAIAVIGWLMVSTNQIHRSLYHWRLLALSVATVALVVAVVHPASRLKEAFAVAPLRWVGERSYGIYLWHLPLVALMPESFLTEWVLLRNIIIVALTLLLAELSWTLMEQPIRVHGFLKALRFRRLNGGGPPIAAGDVGPTLAPFAAWSMTAVIGVCVLTTMALFEKVDLQPTTLPDERTAADISEIAIAPPPPSPTPSSIVAPTSVVTAPTTTSCTSVAHIGDSTSIGLMSKSFLPDATLRIDARYQAVGALTVRTDIVGGRSIVEGFKRQPNAEKSALGIVKAGYTGCWVFALGTNEAANFSSGSAVGAERRIDIMMAVANGQPVMWPTVKTMRLKTSYAGSHMDQFNEALIAACARYPNLRVYDWAAEVEDAWFQKDGIHFTSAGYAERGRRFASALAQAFPVGTAPSPTCVIGS